MFCLIYPLMKSKNQKLENKIMSQKLTGLIIALVIAIFALLQTFFIVDETEQALVLQFGQPKEIIRQAGLHNKLPFLQQVELYDKRILDIDPEPEVVILRSKTGGLLAKVSESLSEETPSSRQNNRDVSGEPIIVDTFARYRITDPLKFRQRLSSESAAIVRLKNEMSSSTRDVLGNATLESLLSKERTALMNNIRDRVNERVNNLGLEIVDIRIGRADLTDSLRQATFNRMKSEREQQATETRAMGEQRALEITSTAEKERTVLLAEAKKDAAILRGQGDQEATKIYADAFRQDPEFYSFYRSLEAYRKGFSEGGTTLLLNNDDEFMRYFRNRSGR